MFWLFQCTFSEGTGLTKNFAVLGVRWRLNSYRMARLVRLKVSRSQRVNSRRLSVDPTRKKNLGRFGVQWSRCASYHVEEFADAREGNAEQTNGFLFITIRRGKSGKHVRTKIFELKKESKDGQVVSPLSYVGQTLDFLGEKKGLRGAQVQGRGWRTRCPAGDDK